MSHTGSWSPGKWVCEVPIIMCTCKCLIITLLGCLDVCSGAGFSLVAEAVCRECIFSCAEIGKKGDKARTGFSNLPCCLTGALYHMSPGILGPAVLMLSGRDPWKGWQQVQFYSYIGHISDTAVLAQSETMTMTSIPRTVCPLSFSLTHKHTHAPSCTKLQTLLLVDLWESNKCAISIVL